MQLRVDVREADAQSLMMQPAIAHLKADLRILDETHHIGRLLAVHVGDQLDQRLPHRVVDFGRDLMEREFAFHLDALDQLVPGDPERNAELVQGKRYLPGYLRCIAQRWIDQMQQLLAQLG